MTRRGLVGVAAALVACASPPETPFIDVTAASGIGADLAPAYDAALADVDGDGRLDIYVGNHGAGARLWHNTGALTFRDATAASGLDAGGDQHGAGFGDADGDGRPDLYVGVGADRGRRVKANRLWRRTADGRFADVAPDAGVTDPTGRARGVAWVDVDRDGRLDLFVANYKTPNALFRNRGDGGFDEVAAAAGLARPSTLRAVWTDVDGDGAPDVLFTATASGLRLMRNRGDGTFADVTAASGLPRWPPVQGAAFGDVDGDGDLDLAVAAGTDYPSSLVVADGWATFVIRPARSGSGLDLRGPLVPPGVEAWSRGEAVPAGGALAVAGVGHGRVHLRWRGGDTDLAGRIGPGVTAAAPVGFRAWRARDPHRVFRNRGDGTFGPPEALPGRGNGQGVAWADVDADGDLDLYVVQSGVEGADEPDALYLNDGTGRLVVVATSPGVGRGCGAHFADLDEDGRLDLFVTAGWGPTPLAAGRPRLFRNGAPPRRWLLVDLVGRASNRPGLGAWVVVDTDTHHVARYHDGGSLYSFSLAPVHLGLAQAARARLTVRWPSGVVDVRETPTNRRVRVVEGGRR